MFVDALHSPFRSGSQAPAVCNRHGGLRVVLSTTPQGRPHISSHRRLYFPRRSCTTPTHICKLQLRPQSRHSGCNVPREKHQLQLSAQCVEGEKQLSTKAPQQRKCAESSRQEAYKLFLSGLAACLVVSTAPCTAAELAQVSTALAQISSK